MSTPLENDPQKSPFLHAAPPLGKRRPAASSPTATTTPTSTSSAPSPLLRGLLAGLLVVVLGGGVLWWLMRTDAPESETEREEKKSMHVVDVVPQIATNRPAVVQEPEAKPRELKPWNYPIDRTNELCDAHLRKWRALHRPKPRYTNNATLFMAPPKYAIFKHRSENEIAGLLAAKPGMAAVGTPIYGKWLKEDFLKSLENPIVVEPTDSAEDADLKRAMIATKMELKEQIDAGADIGEILLASRRELQDLARYKQTLQNELYALRHRENVTAQDVADFVEASNRLLEQKGIAPLKLGVITRRMLERNKGGN